MIVDIVVKILVCLAFTMSVVTAYSDDDIKRIRVSDAELLCRVEKDIVDTISFMSISNNSVAVGRDFLHKIDRTFMEIRNKNLRMSNELRLCLGCNLPFEMKQTLYQVVSEHYARSFARKNYAISCSGREYAHKLVDRGYFRKLDSKLSVHGYRVKSVCLEKVIVDRKREVAVASVDIVLKRQTANGVASQEGGITGDYSFRLEAVCREFPCTI
ncbi:MAG: hypothetical protein MJ249_02015 [Kiritimatiellae bacterium]|nr:hypothetical protein [Kiritimatiellia bacterium]